MSKDRPRLPPSPRSWLERLGQALLGEVSDRAQLTQLLRDAHRREVLEQEILHMMEGALRIAEKQVADVMVPRAQMVSVQHDEKPDEFLPRLLEAEHSRYPIIGARGDVIGILLAKDLLRYCFSLQPGTRFELAELQRPPMFVPASKRLSGLLHQLRTTRNHMAIVVDEFGATSGLVTIEDILEEIVGEIEDEHDSEMRVDYIFKRGTERYVVKALTPIATFNSYFSADLPSTEADTIGGLVTHQLGHLPQKGDRIQFGNFEFTVTNADERRVHLLDVARCPTVDDAAEA